MGTARNRTEPNERIVRETPGILLYHGVNGMGIEEIDEVRMRTLDDEFETKCFKKDLLNQQYGGLTLLHFLETVRPTERDKLVDEPCYRQVPELYRARKSWNGRPLQRHVVFVHILQFLWRGRCTKLRRPARG